MLRFTKYFYYFTFGICASLLIISYWPSGNSSQTETFEIREDVLHAAQQRSKMLQSEQVETPKPIIPFIQTNQESAGSDDKQLEAVESSETLETDNVTTQKQAVLAESTRSSLQDVQLQTTRDQTTRRPTTRDQTTKKQTTRKQKTVEPLSEEDSEPTPRRVNLKLLHLSSTTVASQKLEDATSTTMHRARALEHKLSTVSSITKKHEQYRTTLHRNIQEEVQVSTALSATSQENHKATIVIETTNSYFVRTTPVVLLNNSQSQPESTEVKGGTKCGNELMSMPMYLNKTLMKYGKAFSCDLMEYLRETGLSGESTEEVKEFKSEDVVYVTYSSANHYYESKLALMMLRNISMNKIIYYDIGLAEEQVAELKTFCNLEYRNFNFTRYPSFVKNLMTYSFKPILIAEIYKDFPVFWFIDASTHFYDPVKLEVFYRESSNNKYGKFIGRSPTGHSIHAATHPGMYDYLPIDEQLRRNNTMFAAWMFVLRSPLSREAVKWNFLCALTQECIAPSGSRLGCKFGKNWYGEYAKCHRYDQSSINIVLNNLFEKYGARPPKEGSEFGEFFKVQRTASYKKPLQVGCQNSTGKA